MIMVVDFCPCDNRVMAEIILICKEGSKEFSI